MAQINLKKIKRIEKQRNTIHSEVCTTYTVFEDNGEKYFQIDTYGKDEREMPEKISQSFQLNRESAKYLVNLIVNEYSLK